MHSADHKRLLLTRVLDQYSKVMPRPARRFLEAVLVDDTVLDRMEFCRSDERSRLRNSILIALSEVTCWSVLMGNEPDTSGGQRSRTRLALEGLDLDPETVMTRLRSLPIWFLAVDPSTESVPQGEAVRLEMTAYRLARLDRGAIRRLAIHDQLDAALAANDFEACRRIQSLLDPQGET